MIDLLLLGQVFQTRRAFNIYLVYSHFDISLFSIIYQFDAARYISIRTSKYRSQGPTRDAHLDLNHTPLTDELALFLPFLTP